MASPERIIRKSLKPLGHVWECIEGTNDLWVISAGFCWWPLRFENFGVYSSNEKKWVINPEFDGQSIKRVGDIIVARNITGQMHAFYSIKTDKCVEWCGNSTAIEVSPFGNVIVIYLNRKSASVYSFTVGWLRLPSCDRVDVLTDDLLRIKASGANLYGVYSISAEKMIHLCTYDEIAYIDGKIFASTGTSLDKFPVPAKPSR